MPAYTSAEDSFLLAEAVKSYAFGDVLDMGTGSGILAIAAAGCRRVKSITAVDIDEEALLAARKNAKGHRIKFLQSDLFENVKGKFDTIIFNPPYLPQDKEFHDRALHGGKKGYEVIERFLAACNGYLRKDSIILLLFSSLTKKEKVDEFIERNCLKKELLSSQKMFFEELFAYKISKSKLLKRLEGKGISNVKLFAKGHRGIVYTGVLRGKKVAVKAKKKESLAVRRIENEAYWLRRLNPFRIAPKIIFSGQGFFCYEFVEGSLIRDFMQTSRKGRLRYVLRQVFRQCRVLDSLKVDKEEMHHPVKHVIIGSSVVLVDFERCHYSRKPKNVTQFCQFIRSTGKLLEEKGIIINKKWLSAAAKAYKDRQNGENFRRIISVLK
ncbi:MAG: HemK2/MTQ2 family protein methyltransferase [Candidatus Woesearchaeota archaeon]